MPEEKTVVIKIDTWTFVRFWLVIFAFLLIGWALWSIRAGLVIVFTALFFSVILNPLVSMLARLISGSRDKRRPLAVFLAYAIVVLVVGGILAAIVPLVAAQIGHFFDSMPAIIEQSSNSLGALSSLAEQYGVGDYFSNAISSVQSYASGILSDFQGGFLSSASSLFSFLASGFLVMVLTYLFLSEGSILMKDFWGKRPTTEANTKLQRTMSRIARAFSDYARGQLTVALLDATFSTMLIFVLSLIFGLPVGFSLPLGLFLGIMCLIPMFGATIGAIIVAILLSFSSLPAGIIFMIAYFTYQQIENVIIVPRIHSRTATMSPLIILIAITIGLYTGGIIGAVLAVPIANCLRVIYEEYGTDIRKTVSRKKK